MRTLAVLSLHTSPLVQPGAGDSGGMNVYVRELVSSLAQAGVRCSVYTRRWADDLPAEVAVEPGFRVVHVPAGPIGLRKDQLPDVVEEFTAGVLSDVRALGDVDAIHANYWLSGLAGHELKHRLDVPLVSTFHTLARVKAETGDAEPELRIRAEAEVIACSDAITASCPAEADQLVRLYGAAPERIELVAPGVIQAFFSPGDRAGARRALGLDPLAPVLLFVGRIQPLKGLDVAIRALAELRREDAVLVVVGGASGIDGPSEQAKAVLLAEELGVAGRIRWVRPQPHHLLSTFYRAADVCVVPSRSESFGLVALEAGACGTPVVAANVGGLATLVDHTSTGYLVEGRSPEPYAELIDGLLADPAKAAAMGAAAAERARRFTWSTTAARLRRLYADLTVRSLVECGA
ncbi:MAG: glycosyltransferase [Acidimicrobiales bacterium]